MSNAPTESKVYAATIGGGSGAITTTFILWILGVTVFRTPYDADSAQAAVLAVPGPVSAFIGLLLTAGGAYLGGWWAKHTPRAVESYVPRRALDESETVALPETEAASEPVSKEYTPDVSDEDDEDLSPEVSKNV